MERNWAERIAIALDLDDFNSACQIMDKLGDSAKLYKVGPQLFTRVGPDIIKEIKNRGKNVFLDLKFHDIPNTVAKASESAVELGVDIFNIHISGGIEMMTKSASATKLKAIQLGIKKPILLGVTVLTSMDIKELQTIYDTKRD
ncbi:TPA: orotidine-5'-phosphate decarboxylase, partial [Candidatus Poribacteria bacterium]|nr:orotidine-5'-phosphate decarboxylase [Candidatus Poribacteria bacterium]